jgi:hypothetical protein
MFNNYSYSKTLWFARKVRREFIYYPKRHAIETLHRASVLVFTRRRGLHPKTPKTLNPRAENTAVYRSIFCNFSCSTNPGILNVAPAGTSPKFHMESLWVMANGVYPMNFTNTMSG